MSKRVIKFRAWSHGMRYFEKPEDFKWFFAGNDGPEQTLSECGLMQYTGYRDSAGKEIYEGDIVVNGFDFQSTDVIVFIAGGFGTDCYPIDDLVNMQVIGNIYESPELLKGE